MSPAEPSPPDRSAADATSSQAMRSALERELAGGPPGGLPCVPPLVPDHALLHRIGRGAYGEVWLARSTLGTLRAVKIVSRARFKDDHPYEREFNGILKYEPLSRTHEGLVQVLHVGRGEGCFYCVMELADPEAEQVGKWESEKVGGGAAASVSPAHFPTFPLANFIPRTLRSKLARRPRLPPIEAAQLTLRLAGALAHLHAHGLVHRDIKPSNVIFVGGRPKLADIGLVTDVGSSQSFVGTEGFIPPEGPGTPQADLYGLGKLLYELATGRDRMDFPQLPPLGAPASSRRAHDEKEVHAGKMPALPDDDEALLELNEVMTRACAPDPTQRYASATELQADLNLFLAGRSLRHARNIERTLVRLKRFAAVACVGLALAAGVLWFVKNEERHANDRERQATERARTETALRQRAEGAERATERQLYTALLEQARATVLSGEMGQRVRALDAVRRAAAISNSAELRGVAVSALALPDLRFERELPVPSNVNVARHDPAFERVAIGADAGNGPIEIRSLSDYGLLATLPPSTNRPISSFGLWSRDGRFFAVTRDQQGSRGAKLEVWDVAAERRVLLAHVSSRASFSFHSRLPRIIVGRLPRAAVTWDLESGQELASQPLEGRPRLLSFAPDGESFAALHDVGSQSRLTLHSGEDGVSGATHLFTNHVHEIGWHPSGRWIAVGDDKGGVLAMDARSGETQLLGRHKSDTAVLEFSPDGKYLFSGGWDLELICWDVRAMRQAFTVALDSYHIQFRADGRQCAITRWPEARVQLHSFEWPALHREFAEDLGGPRSSAAFSRDGRWLAAVGDERLVVWDLNNIDGPGAVMKGIPDTRVSFAANGELFVNPRGGGSRWSVASGTDAASPPELTRLDFPRPPGLFSFCLVSNGIVLTGTNGSSLVAFDRIAAKDTHWTPTTSGVSGVSPDQRWLAIFRPFSPHLYVHRLPGLERVAKLTNGFRINYVEFSPASDEVAVGCREGVEVWSTTTWQRTRHLTNFTELLYSPDGRTFWLSAKFRSASLHLARTAEPLLPLPPNTRPLAASPDGRLLAVTVDSRRVQVWDLAEVRLRLRELGLDWTDGGR